MKPNNIKTVLCWALFVITIGFLFFVWVPMMQRDNNIDAQKVLRDSQAALDDVRAKLHNIQLQNPDATTLSESSEAVLLETK